MALSPLAAQVKAFLKAFADEEIEIDNQIERLARLDARMEGLGATVLSDMPRAPSPPLDRMESMMIQKVSLETAIADAIRAHDETRKMLDGLLMTITSNERASIRMRYFDGEEWSAITECMFGNLEDFAEKRESYERRAYRVHDSALERMASKWSSCKTESDEN